jgi:hypothetical protein
MRIFFIVYLFCFVGAFTQEKEVLTGHVFEIENDSLSPLPGVHVYYLGTKKGSTTNEKGLFSLNHDHSNHQLVFSFIGYEPDTLTIEHNQEINVVMGEGKILKDFEIEFRRGSYSFSKIDPRHAHIIGQDELRKAACCNLAESFETNPSIDATFTDAVTGTKQIQMMGLSGKYVQMLSGNIPVIRGLSTLYGLKQIPGTFIHQIAVSKGAGSVLNGYESMVGQINMNLKQPENAEKLHLNLYLNQGGRAEYNAFFSKEIGKRWATTFLAHFEDQTRENDRNNDGFLDNPLTNDYIIYNQWNYRSKFIHMELGANAVLSTMKSGKLKTFPDPKYPVNIETGQVNAFTKIGYLFPNDDFKSLALQLSTSYNQQNTTIGQTNYEGSQLSGYANLIYQQKIGEDHEENYFKIGASCQLDSVNEKLRLSYVYDSTFSGLDFNWLEVVPGLFGEFTHNSEKWGVIAGLRGDYTSFYDKFFLTPRLHLRYSLSSETALKIMAGSGRKTPFMMMENIGFMATSRKWNFNSYGLIGLGQEYSWNFGLALLKEFTLFNRDGTLSFDAYHTFFENQLVVDLDQSARQVDFYALDGRSYSNSAQAEINYKVNRRWELRTAYRFLDVKKDYQSGLKEKPLLSKHRGFINIAYSSRIRQHKQWKADLTTQWIGSQRIPFTQDNEVEFQLPERSEDYVMISGQITRIFGKRTEAYIGVENALNYKQTNPILSSETPYGDNFDSSIIWAPIFGRMIYIGFRFTINQDEDHHD